MSLDQYLPVLLFILVGLAVGVLPQLIGYVLGPNRPDAAKNSPTNVASRPSRTRA